MGAYPSNTHWYTSELESRDVTVSEEHLRKILADVEGIVKHWTDIIGNMKTSKEISPEQKDYLLFEAEETEQKWTSLTQSVRPAKQPEQSRHRKQVKRSEDNYYMGRSEEKSTGTSQQTERDLNVKPNEKDNKAEFLLKEQEIHIKEIKELKQEVKDLRLRLSRIASEQLLKDNPNIADLGDANRPTKLGEIYSELYDNEYTDSQDALTDAGYTERETIDILRETLLNTFKFCTEKSTAILSLTEDALKTLLIETKQSKMKGNCNRLLERKQVSNTMLHGTCLDMYVAMDEGTTEVDDLKFALKWKPKQKEGVEPNKKCEANQKQSENSGEVLKEFEEQMKLLRKKISTSVISTVQQAYFRTRWDSECIAALKPFIEKCVFVSWMMNVQLPPMTFLECPSGPDETLKVDQYSYYTERGDLLDFVVWPTMLLTKGGPVVAKGVAQGK